MQVGRATVLLTGSRRGGVVYGGIFGICALFGCHHSRHQHPLGGMSTPSNPLSGHWLCVRPYWVDTLSYVMGVGCVPPPSSLDHSPSARPVRNNPTVFGDISAAQQDTQ